MIMRSARRFGRPTGRQVLGCLLLVLVAFPVPVNGQRSRDQAAEAGRRAVRPGRTARPLRPRTTPRATATLTPPQAKAAALAGGGKVLPGEAEFNECIRIPKRRRIKVTLKPESTLKDLVGWISSMTCKRFIIGSNVHTQKVTLISPTPVTAAEAYRAFLSAIDVMGLTVVPSGRYLKVLQGNWAIQSSIPTFTGLDEKRIPRTDQIVTQLVRVENVDVNQLLLVLNKMKSRSGDITAYRPSNTLIITDSGHNVRRLLTIIKELDVETAGEKIWVVRLRHGDVEDIKKILDQLFAQKGNKPKIPRLGKSAKGAGAEGVPSASKIIADTTTNSLIIVASATAFARIASLLKKFDVEDSGAGSQRIHVYYLENADAGEMAQTLASLTGGSTTRRTKGRRGRTKSKAPTQAASLFEGEVKVSADKATNSLVIVASTRDFLNLRAVVRKLDIPRRQVFVEASILEVTLNKDRKLGVSYHGGGVAGEGDSQSIIFGGVQHSALGSLVLDPLALMGMAVGARGSPIDGSAELLGLPADIPGFGVMFQALQSNSNVNVLSSPHILTTDNEEAEITVGQNIPFQGAIMGGGFGAAAAAGGLGSMIPAISVQRQDVALKLKLTPHVNDSDMVRLEIEQEVSDIISPNFNNLGPATSKRTAKTTVVVRDQQTVVIGGLMSDRTQESESKVPLLGDIPIIGYLFKHTTKTLQKTNLLIVLTPYVIRDQSDLRRIFQKKLRERREFIERYTSFQRQDPGAEIDYRHKRGLLAEIHRVGIQVEHEAELLRKAREETEEQIDPVEMPEGMTTPPGPPTVAPGVLKKAVIKSPVVPGARARPRPRIR